MNSLKQHRNIPKDVGNYHWKFVFCERIWDFSVLAFNRFLCTEWMDFPRFSRFLTRKGVGRTVESSRDHRKSFTDTVEWSWTAGSRLRGLSGVSESKISNLTFRHLLMDEETVNLVKSSTGFLHTIVLAVSQMSRVSVEHW